MTTRSVTTKKTQLGTSAAAWQPPLHAGSARQPVNSQKPRSWSPEAYQKRAVKFLLERGAAALFLDPGMGKTSITLATLKVLKRDGQMRGALVIAPLRPAKLVWPAELQKWTDFHGLSMGVLHGDKKMKVLEEDHDIYVTNHETIPWFFKRHKPLNPKTGRPVQAFKNELTEAGRLLLSKVNILVLDELSKFKHYDTKRFTLIEPWLPKFDRRYGLTGSPAANGLMDLFGQCLVLDGGRTLGRYITYFREQYFTSVGESGFVYVPKHGAAEAIYERVRPLALRMDAEDHMKLPKLRPFPIKYDLPPSVRPHYDQMETKLLAIIKDETLTAPNAASSQMALRQMCSGAIYTAQVDFITGLKKAGKREWLHLHDEKLNAMEELIGELQGQQLMVAYEFKHDLERILARWPGLPYFGRTEREDKRLQDGWNAGTLPIVLGQAASVGHGLNLQDSHAHNVLWFTLTWDYELFDQFNRRLRRRGNNSAYMNCYMLCARDSVEESVAATLRDKKNTQDDLLNALKRRKRLDE